MTPAEEFRAALDTYHQAALTVAQEAGRLLVQPDPQQPCCPRPDLYLNTVGLTEAQHLEWLVDDGPVWHEDDGGWDSVSTGQPAFVECMTCHSVFTPPVNYEKS